MKTRTKKKYESAPRLLQIELVKLQRHVIACNDNIPIFVEGRDAAGEDALIKRIVEPVSPRETRVVALGKPPDRERIKFSPCRMSGCKSTACMLPSRLLEKSAVR